MRLVEGETYRAANGEKIESVASFYGGLIREVGDGYIWNQDGTNRRTPGGFPDPKFNIVSLWTEASPIRTETVTTRRIEPGVYGRLSVHNGTSEAKNVFAGITNMYGKDNGCQLLNAPELRELARVALELAEYLDDR